MFHVLLPKRMSFILNVQRNIKHQTMFETSEATVIIALVV